MHAPPDVVPGLCTTASAYLATGSLILVYAMNEETHEFAAFEILAILTMLIALTFIGFVPWLISKPMKNEASINLRAARKSLATGTILFFTATSFLAINAITKEDKLTTKQQSKQIKNTKGIQSGVRHFLKIQI